MRLEEAAATFEAVAREWHGQQVSGWEPRHAADVLKSLEQDVFPRIGALPIKEITSPMVLDVVRAIEDRPSIETARRVRQRISAVHAYAIASGLADADPAAPIRAALKPLIKGRQPALATLEEARALLRKVEEVPAHPMTKLAWRLLALTALRQGVLRTTMWSELEGLDREESVWRIPAARMKLKLDRKIDARFDFLLPLSRQALEVLDAARAFAPYSRLVFPSQRHTYKPISENAVGYLYNRLVAHGRHVPHGWRSTFSTIMNERAQAQARCPACSTRILNISAGSNGGRPPLPRTLRRSAATNGPRKTSKSTTDASPLQRITGRTQRLVPVRKIKETRLARHQCLRSITKAMNHPTPLSASSFSKRPVVRRSKQSFRSHKTQREMGG